MSPDKVWVNLQAYRDNTVEDTGRGYVGTADLAVVAKRLGCRPDSPELLGALMCLKQHGQVYRMQDGKVVFKVI